MYTKECLLKNQAAIQPYIADNIDLMPPKEGQVLIRVSQEEKKLMQKAADAEDRTVSDWVRLTVKNRLRQLGLMPEKKPIAKKLDE